MSNEILTQAEMERLGALVSKPLMDCTGGEIQETVELLERHKVAISQLQQASASAVTPATARHPARIAMDYVSVNIEHDGDKIDEYADYLAAMAEVDRASKGANLTGSEGVLAHLARFVAVLMIANSNGNRQLALTQAMEAADSYPVFDGDDYPVVGN